MRRFLGPSLLFAVLAWGPQEQAWGQAIGLSAGLTGKPLVLIGSPEAPSPADEASAPSEPAEASSPVANAPNPSEPVDTTPPVQTANDAATPTGSTSTASAAPSANNPAAAPQTPAAAALAAAPNEPTASSGKIFPNVPGLRLTGAAAVWARGFLERPQWDGQKNSSFWPNIEGWIKAEYSWNNGSDRFNFMPYARKDFYGSRSLLDVKEGYYLHAGDGWSVLAGINSLHWGVTESRHLVNIINQIDYSWSIDGDEVLGQPMVNGNITTPMGTLSLYGLFGFRPVHQDRIEDRLRPQFVSTGETVLANEVEKDINFAGRFSSTFPLFSGSVDAAFSYFHGIGREPRFVVVVPPTPVSPTPQIASFYDMIDQGGLEFVATFNALQLKFEGIVRHEFGETYGATVAGFEYTFFDVANSGTDVGIVAEHLSDNRSNLQPPTIYAHDVFLGGRLTFNNSVNTNFLGGLLYNYNDQARYAIARLTTRVQDDLSLQLEARYFLYAPESDALFSVLHDNFVQARVIKYF